jgi:hypothetical protein
MAFESSGIALDRLLSIDGARHPRGGTELSQAGFYASDSLAGDLQKHLERLESGYVSLASSLRFNAVSAAPKMPKSTEIVENAYTSPTQAI